MPDELDLTPFRPGERVELVRTNDSMTRLVPGARGTVTLVFDDAECGPIVSVAWDDGSRLSMLLGEGDLIKHVTEAKPDNQFRKERRQADLNAAAMSRHADRITASLRSPRCADCGEIGERTGHMTCQYPQDR